MKIKLLVNLTDVGKLGDVVDVKDEDGQRFCESRYATKVSDDGDVAAHHDPVQPPADETPPPGTHPHHTVAPSPLPPNVHE